MSHKYVAYAEDLEQLREAYYEALTNISLDSVKDEFKSLLNDMESSAEDFADSFEKMMQEAVINAFVNDVFDEQLETWYDHFVKAMETNDKMTAYEQAQLQKEWDGMVKNAIEQRDALAKAMGWDTSSMQQSSSRSLEGMTQDTADAIEGRLTAMQIAVETIRATHQIEAANVAELNNSMLAMLQTEQNYSIFYENLERQIAKIYLEVQGINENTEAMVKPIQSMQISMENIERKIKNL